MPLFRNENEMQKRNVPQGKRTQSINYSKHVPQSPELVKPGSNPFYILRNLQDTTRWSLGLLQDGKDMDGDNMRIGDRYFVKSGTCSNTKSTPECQGRSRYIYVNNVPTATLPCSDPNQPSDPKSAKMPQGLLAGVVQDIVHLNPFELINSSMGSGSIVNDACERRRERVDPILPGRRERPRYQTRCAPRPAPLICSLSSLKQSSCLRYTFNDTPHVKAYNADMKVILNSLTSQDYQFHSIGVIDQKRMATNPNQKYWMRLSQIANYAFQDALIHKHKNPSISVHSHKHCLGQGVEMVDRGKRRWLKATWSNLYLIKFENLTTSIPVRKNDRVHALQKTLNKRSYGRILNIHNTDGALTYDIKFDDNSEQNHTHPVDIEMHYEFQVLWTACYNKHSPKRNDKYFKGDRVRVKRNGMYPLKNAKILQSNGNNTYNVKYYDNNTTENNVKSVDIETIRHLLVSADVIGNSYKAFSEEPKDYYIIGVREPFSNPPFVSDDDQNTTMYNTRITIALLIVIVVLILFKMHITNNK